MKYTHIRKYVRHDAAETKAPILTYTHTYTYTHRANIVLFTLPVMFIAVRERLKWVRVFDDAVVVVLVFMLT